ncbi:hypothetical protein P1P75_39680 [Streptomyces sp. ID05-39B]|uniref:hypothetical protein n=1 Tax=Streptomyces sp. ID05-39B TaxID=3028664 RepID=UPI0029B7DEB3|nr:hypothetical protein [Streptomyces sp. ID05-39B]MDX3532353.1 hypothetical protein [Streptomyces sp. ID05-39B]
MRLPLRRPGRTPTLARARTRATRDTSIPLWPARLAADLLQRLASEARRIEQDLRLTTITSASDDRQVAGAVPTASAQLATVLAQLADERSGPLATVRGLIEHAAYRASLQPCTGPDTAHQLELIARRIYGTQQDLDDVAARLTTRSKRSTAAPVVPAARACAGQSP